MAVFTWVRYYEIQCEIQGCKEEAGKFTISFHLFIDWYIHLDIYFPICLFYFFYISATQFYNSVFTSALIGFLSFASVLALCYLFYSLHTEMINSLPKCVLKRGGSVDYYFVFHRSSLHDVFMVLLTKITILRCIKVYKYIVQKGLTQRYWKPLYKLKLCGKIIYVLSDDLNINDVS